MDNIELTILSQLVVSGIIAGSIYGLIALGFVVIYKATKVVNFAQGEIMMLGAYFCYYLVVTHQIPFLAAFAITLVFSALLGIVTEFLVLRPMVGEPTFSVIMITVGLGTLLRSAVGFIWGHDNLALPPPWGDTTWDIGIMAVSPAEVYTVAATFFLLGMLWAFFKYSKMGLATRATAFDQRWSFLMGINVHKVFSLAWALASVVAAVGGVFLAFMGGLEPNMGFIGMKVFPAVVLGGIESIGGAILGGLVIGLCESLAGGYLSEWFGSGVKELSAFLVLLLVLMFKPYGLFGKEEIIRV